MSEDRWPSRRTGSIDVLEMYDGEVGQIVEWPYAHYIGTIVQRYKDVLLALGCPSGDSFDRVFTTVSSGACKRTIRLLPNLQKLLYTHLPYPVDWASATVPPAVVARDPFRRLEFDDEADE